MADETGKLFLPLEFVRTMVFDGVFPKEWKKRSWGVMDVAKHERDGDFQSDTCKKINGLVGKAEEINGKISMIGAYDSGTLKTLKSKLAHFFT